LIIYEPQKIVKDDEVIIKAAFDSNNKRQELWFSFNKRYENYIITENADAFLVGLLLLAMKNGENIDVQAQVSAKLYYQLNHYLINALNLANNDWKKINIRVKSINDKDLCIKPSAGTGISCGVDSFATIYDHLNEVDNFRIKYFTFFNAGSHGDFGGDKARRVFKDRLKLVKSYADDINKQIIEIDTNLNEILMMNHQQTHTIRDVACVLNLQKLFRYYYYASAYRFNHFKLNQNDMADYDILLLSLLSTESTTFYSAVSQYTRVERTRNITEYPYTYKYLNVCTAASKTGRVENCSVCNKCLRTQITLDLLGKLDLYQDVFDLKKYSNKKEKYVGQILSQKNSDIFSKEIYSLIKNKNYHVPLISYFYCVLYTIKKLLKYLFNTFKEKRSK